MVIIENNIIYLIPTMSIPNESIGREAQELIQILDRCASACEACQILATKEAPGLLQRCAEIAGDCSQTCRLAIRLLRARNLNIQKFLIICSDICKECAEECAKYPMEYAKQCTDTCLKCAEICHHQ